MNSSSEWSCTERSICEEIVIAQRKQRGKELDMLHGREECTRWQLWLIKPMQNQVQGKLPGKFR
jgi:hypothetical protein